MGGPHSVDVDVVVVIVTYKSALPAIDSLRSLHAERTTPRLQIRVIVVDNASGDLPQIAQAVASYGWSDWVTLVAAPRNGGFAYGNNLGMERAYAAGRPDYIYLLNPDTQVREGAIGTLTGFLESHPEVGIAGSSFETRDGRDWPFAFRFPSLASEIDDGLETGVVTRLLQRYVVARCMGRTTPEAVDWISGASMMIRPEVFMTIGGLDENYFLYFEETDFCRRARAAGFSTWYVPGSRVMHVGGHSTQVTGAYAGTKRFPSYWFESRRRYFVRAFGIHHAMVIDLAAIFANSLGWLKRALLRRRHAKPYFIRDLVRHSVLWRANRDVRPLRCWRPQGEC